MSNTREIKSHIKGVKNTQKITQAVETMASIRFQKAGKRALHSRPYVFRLNEILTDLAPFLTPAEIFNLPLLQKNPAGPVLYVVFTSDRGLCGNFNTKIIEAVIQQQENSQPEPKFIVVGAKGLAPLKKAGFEIISSFTSLPPVPTLSLTGLIVADCVQAYLSGRVSEIRLVYNHYVSTTVSQINFMKFLSIEPEEIFKKEVKNLAGFICEPSAAGVVESLLPYYLQGSLFQILLESYASEYAARMIAMDLATRNAQKMIEELTLDYNKSRQAAITTEIIEVVSSAEAIK